MKLGINLNKTAGIFKSKKLKLLLKRTPRFLVRRAFCLFLFLVSLGLIWGLFIFYQYTFPSKKEIILRDKQFEIDTSLLNSVLEEIEQRQKEFQRIEEKQYSDPFKAIGTVETVEELTE